MATRLTNNMREEIVDSVMRATDLAEQRKAIENETIEMAAKACRDAQPTGWFELIKGYPAAWFKLDGSVYVKGGFNPLARLAGYTHGMHINYPAPIPVAAELSLSEAQCSMFAALCERADAWFEANVAARGELIGFLRSCNTVEKVIERMPELARHVPKAGKVWPLAAPNNVMSRLSKLGFDRTVSA